MSVSCWYRRYIRLRARLYKRVRPFIYVCLGIVLSVLVSAATASSNAAMTSHSLADSTASMLALAEDELQQGREYYKAGRFSAAAADWEAAAVSFRMQGNSVREALALSYLTATYQQLGQWENARRSIDDSLALVTSKPFLESGHDLVVAQVYNTYGSLEFATGHAQSALEIWQRAAELYLQNEDSARYFNNLLNQVQAQQTLGYYHQVSSTLSTLEQYLPQQAADVRVNGYQKIGKAYRLVGDLAVAEARLETALELAESLVLNSGSSAGGQANSRSVDVGSILIELGNTAQLKGEYERAIAHYQNALARSNNSHTQLTAQLNQLKILAASDPAAARQATDSLSANLSLLPPGRTQTYAYINAAQSLLLLGTPSDIERATRWLAEALQQSVALADRRAQSYAKGYLGHAYELSRQWADASMLTKEALTDAKTISAADVAYQWEWQLGRLLKQQNKREDALAAYRASFSSLQSIKQDLSAVNQDLQFSFRDSVEPVYRELVDLLLQEPERSVTDVRSLQAKRKEAREVIESLQVAELDNFFRTACLDAQTVALEAVEETDAAVVYPIILSDRIETLVSFPGQPLQQYTAIVSQTQLEQTLVAWRQNLEKPFTTPEGRALGQTLYQWLILPMQADLDKANVTTLTFVLDGALRNVPMAALYSGEEYLIEKYAIALSPGLQLLGPKSLQDTSSAALLAGLTEARHGFGELTNVADELAAVRDLVSSSLLLNEDFTTNSLAQQVAGSDRPILHLATHGQFSSNAEETFILAWDRPIPVVELSNLLKAGDLNRLDPIELLILSACETASGDSRAALGLAGVALQSGTRSTLASLWNLDDASGATFVEQFYQALAQPDTTKAEALRQAQLTLLQNPNYRHPTYWAAYVLLGNWL